MTTTNRKHRIMIASGRLAVSAALRDDGEGEVTAAAQTAGRLAYEAGVSLDELATAVPGLLGCSMAWCVVVDAYYDARDASDATEAEVMSYLATLEGGSAGASVVTRLWAEVRRRRG